MATIRDIVFDARHSTSRARFWAAALDGYDVAPYDEAELERLRGEGIDDHEYDSTVLVEPAGEGPRLWFQRVPEPRIAKSRVHLDLTADDVDAEVERLVALGATRLAHQPTPSLVVFLDPEGNDFCLLR
jgi:hypothetical protein